MPHYFFIRGQLWVQLAGSENPFPVRPLRPPPAKTSPTPELLGQKGVDADNCEEGPSVSLTASETSFEDTQEESETPSESSAPGQDEPQSRKGYWKARLTAKDDNLDILTPRQKQTRSQLSDSLGNIANEFVLQCCWTHSM
jgi:hypothetical protein